MDKPDVGKHPLRPCGRAKRQKDFCRTAEADRGALAVSNLGGVSGGAREITGLVTVSWLFVVFIKRTTGKSQLRHTISLKSSVDNLIRQRQAKSVKVTVGGNDSHDR